MSTVKRRKAFTLIEAITVLVIVAMISVAAINVYARIKKTTESIESRLDKDTLITEVLQRIAEDLDRLAAPGLDTIISIRNKSDSGVEISRMIIENRIVDKDDKPKTFEKITWQSAYDFFQESIVIYRSHSGITSEDKVFHEKIDEADYSRELFIPLCSGITLFKIEALRNETTISQWGSSELPKAIVVSISNSPLYQTLTGEWEIPESEIIKRTIAVDRTRKIKFLFIKQEFDPNDVLEDMEELDETDTDSEETEPEEPNQPSDIEP